MAQVKFFIGQSVEVLDEGIWEAATVVGGTPSQIKVQFSWGSQLTYPAKSVRKA